MSTPPEPHDKFETGVQTSDEVALLPPEVTSATLEIETASPGWTAGNASVLGGQELSDDELLAAVRRGEPKIGSLLYSRLIRVIEATVSRVLGPGEPDHDDCVQAAFEEVVRSIYSGRFQQRCRLTSWAASIACHIGLNAIRSRRTERGIFDRAEDVNHPGLPLPAVHPERELEARDELRHLRVALASLSPGRAETVLLHDALGYGVSEIAALTGSSEAAVQSRLTRGRKDLAERLEALTGRSAP